VEVPEPRYVKTDDGVYIAYQVVGEGPVDISLQHAWLGGLELMWEDPATAVFYEELASFSRLILHDRRATGLSSRNVRPPNLETRVGDLLVVLDAIGSDRTVLLGAFEGGAPNALFASGYPARMHSLIWWGPSAQLVWSPDYPWGSTPDLVEHEMRAVREHWGTKAYGRNWVENNEILLGGGEFAPAPMPEEELARVARVSRHWATPDVAHVPRPAEAGRGGHVYRGADPGLYGALVPRHECRFGVGGDGCDRRRDPAFHRRGTTAAGDRPRARHGPVHGHRRLDREGGRAG
jgi:pimeloyl-ACP methyl ester carboxylesterase